VFIQARWWQSHAAWNARRNPGQRRSTGPLESFRNGLDQTAWYADRSEPPDPMLGIHFSDSCGES